MRERIAWLFDVWIGEASMPQSVRWRRASAAFRVVAMLGALIALLAVTHRVWSTPKPPPLAPDDAAHGTGTRFGLAEAERRKLFGQIAAEEPEGRKKGQRFKEAWRAEDDRAAYERELVRSLANQRHVNVSVAYLVLDEGIRKRWPGPGGTPLEPTVVPLQKK